MANSFNLPEEAVLVGTLGPAADAAGRTGAYISLKNLHKVFAVFYIKQGNAATVACSLSKATAVAGTGATAVTETCRIASSEDQATSHQFTISSAANFTTSATLKDKVVVIEVNPADLGETYDCLAAVTGASNAANITSCMLFGVPRVKAQGVPSVLID